MFGFRGRRSLQKLASSKRTTSSQVACVELVKKHDYENYFIGLLFPKAYRLSFYTIHAFNTEMALVKYSVRGNATAGRVRYKWWNDYVAQLYTADAGKVVHEQHPVADSLRRLIVEKKVSHRWLESLIEARSRDLLSPQLDTLQDMEDTVEKTHSSILYLLLEAMDQVSRDERDAANTPLMHMASHVGVSFGLVSMLRGIAHDLSMGEVRLPLESLLNQGLPPSSLIETVAAGAPLSEQADKALREVVYDVASQAHAHLARAREIQQKEISAEERKQSIAVMLPAVLAADYLETLRQVDFHPLHPTILATTQEKQSPFMMQMKLVKSLWTKAV